ncbi:hypothetical protein WQQ_38830 [Hydrocarboniphaga effusa AP103]|uniref:Uncharacterized protein n=1 Tax=Hydrocarboniphaga effusa AP103 TaxID=1172194 RepID=I8T4N8_9GAMM|nr:hypothetical protein WQQ_38830 [Hydrocarboniphaga effusa AP103]
MGDVADAALRGHAGDGRGAGGARAGQQADEEQDGGDEGCAHVPFLESGCCLWEQR